MPSLFSARFLTNAMMVSALPFTLAAQSNDNEARFVVWGDTQFANKGKFERLVHETNMLNPDFVLQVGDMIQGYTYDHEQVREEWIEYKSQIEPLTMPFYPVPGNHDVVTGPSEEVYREIWGANKLVYSFDHGSAHVIVLDSYWDEEDDTIAQWQREWLAKDLANFAEANGGEGSAELEGKNIFAFLHAPLWRYKADHPGRQAWDEIHEMFQRYPVRLVAGGHTHEYVWENRDGIDYVVLNSSGSMPDRTDRGGAIHCMLHVSLRDNQPPRYAVIEAGSIFPLDTVNSEERATVPEYVFSGGTIRIPEWEPGAAFEKTVSIDLANDLDESRLYNLVWEIPYDVDLNISPLQEWIYLKPGEKASPEFMVTTRSAPGNDEMPVLRVKTSQTLRSGVVSREWEEEYRQREELAANDPSIITTNIELERDVLFEAAHTIFVPPIATATPLARTITVDGKFDEEDWNKTEPITDGEPQDTNMTVRFLYDDDYLYVAARLGEPNPDGMRAEAGGDIPLTWSDDDFELFFDPQNTGVHYSRLFQNVAGTRFNSLPRHIEDKYFTSTYESAIEVGDDYWALEMQIPWKEMTAEKAPKSGDSWSINVGRHRQQREPARSVWTSGLYNPAKYGVLRFL